MALTKTVTKMFPTANTVGIHLVLIDDNRPDLGEGVQKVIDSYISENFVRASGMTNKVRDSVGEKAQELIDEYKKLRQIYDAVAYGTAVNQIDNALTL